MPTEEWELGVGEEGWSFVINARGFERDFEMEGSKKWRKNTDSHALGAKGMVLGMQCAAQKP